VERCQGGGSSKESAGGNVGSGTTLAKLFWQARIASWGAPDASAYLLSCLSSFGVQGGVVRLQDSIGGGMVMEE
jgi:hypothetical protein